MQDVFGNEIRIGDKVAYITRHGSRMNIVRETVTGFWYDPDSYSYNKEGVEVTKSNGRVYKVGIYYLFVDVLSRNEMSDYKHHEIFGDQGR